MSVVVGLVSLVGLVAEPGPGAGAIGKSSQVHLSHLVLPGGDQPWRDGLASLVVTMRRRTNVNMASDLKALGPKSARLDRRPLLWTPSGGALPKLAAGDAARLRRHLTRGGTWVLDGPSSTDKRAAFLASARRIAGRLFPRGKLRHLAAGHTLFKSFYLLSPARLARAAGPVLGVVRDKRAAFIVVHGVAQAADGDPAGWEREPLLRLAVNLVMYALCVDYKSDQVHAPAILKRRRFRPRPPGSGSRP
jgi:hypothetical protein